MAESPPSNLAATRLGPGFVLVVQNEHPPTDREWDAHLQQMDSWVRAANGLMPAMLIVTRGGTPTASQRHRVLVQARRNGAHGGRMAVLTDSVLGRALIRAVNLFQFSQARAFGPSHLERALVFLGQDISPELVRQECARLMDGLSR